MKIIRWFLVDITLNSKVKTKKLKDNFSFYFLPHHMKRIDTQFFEHIQNIPVIDLHGFHGYEVREKMNYELNKLVVNKYEFCRIVHGVGEGVLARIIEEELSQNPLVEAFSRDSHGGSTTIRFYPHR